MYLHSNKFNNNFFYKIKKIKKLINLHLHFFFKYDMMPLISSGFCCGKLLEVIFICLKNLYILGQCFFRKGLAFLWANSLLSLPCFFYA